MFNATLIRFRKPGAKRVSTCDARCYNAKGTKCNCFCNSANHGKGWDHAIKNIVANIPTFKQMGASLSTAVEDAVRELTGGI